MTPGAAVRAQTAAPTMAAQASALRVLAMWRVLPGAIMVLGHASRPVPASGTAQVRFAPASRGAFRALSWPASGPDATGHTFIAALRVPDRADPADGAALVLQASGSELLTLSLPSAPVNDASFGQQVAQAAGPHPAAARFMLDALRPTAGRDVPGVGTMLRAFLSQAATPDGHIELMAAVPGGCVLLQGWGSRITGMVQVLLAGAALPCFPGHAGEYTRADAAPPSTGVMLALPGSAAAALHGVDHVFILSDQGLHSRAVLEHRLLDPVASVGHIRHMLPLLRCPPPMLATLRDALRSRYEGRDTLSGNAHPVRTAIDFSASAPGVGAYLSGWVFDPARIVAELSLCGTQGFTARVDLDWTRIPRPDVTDAYQDKPGFPAPADNDAGFAIFTAASPGPDEPLHLQFTFTDGERAFLPVAMADPADPAVRARLLAGVDLYKPSGPTILERHVAPLMARVRPAPTPPARILVQGRVERPHAVVVPLASPHLPRAFLSGFLHDPLGSVEQLVLLVGPEWHQAELDALCGLVRFYGVPATILATAETARPEAALQEAARVTAAESFLLAGPAVSGRAPGWRQAPRRAALGGDGAAFACPTLLYEDWSIRYAGSTELQFQDIAPYTQAHAPLAGLPAALAFDDAVVPAKIGTLECCLVRRPALAALEGAGALSTGTAREAAFFLRLHAAGLAGVWVPSVQVYAPEDDVDFAQGRAARVVDGWVLRDAWGGRGAG